MGGQGVELGVYTIQNARILLEREIKTDLDRAVIYSEGATNLVRKNTAGRHQLQRTKGAYGTGTSINMGITAPR